jgi:hypothetical protein
VRKSVHCLIKPVWLLLIVLLILPFSLTCVDPASKLKPAEFEVVALDIQSAEVMPGDDVTITATVNNSGELEGVYKAVLKMGQSDIASQDLSIAPDATASTSFKLTAPDSGVYQFSIGETIETLRVYDWQKYKIVYDKCLGSLGEWGFGYTFYSPDAGCSSYFVAPSKFFKINKLIIDAFWRPFDLPNPGDYEFTVKIWSDSVNRELLWSQDFPYSRFRNEGTLQEFEVPDIRTDGNFYVEILPRSERTEMADPMTGEYPPRYALFIGLCVRTDNPNAGVTYKGLPQQWPDNWPSPQESSFMVRVEGEDGPEIR